MAWRESLAGTARRGLRVGFDYLPNRLKWELMAYAPVPYLNIVPADTEEEFVDSGREDVELIIEQLTGYSDSFSVEGADVLEIGVGPGRLLVPFGEAAATVAGVDISRKNLLEAERFADDRGLAPDLRRSKAGLPEFDTSFDLVYAVLAFHHMRRRTAIKYMRDARENLADDGLVYFTFPNLADEDNLETYLSEGLEKTYSFRVRYYLQPEVRLILEELGYTDVEVFEERNQLVAIARG